MANGTLINAYLTAERKRRQAGNVVPVKRQLGAAVPVEPDAPAGSPPAFEPDYTSPAELSERYANTHDTEPEPLFIRKPYSAGFLAGLAGGEQGIRTLLAAKEQYLRRKEEMGRQKLEQEQQEDLRRERRNLMAERLEAPELAGDLGVTEALQRLRDRPKPKAKPITVAPGSSLVDPETGKIITTVPDRAKSEKDTEKEEEDLRKEIRSRKESIRKEVVRLDQDINQTKREIAKAEASTDSDGDPDRLEEIPALEKQLRDLEGARRNLIGQPGGFAATMGSRVIPPTPSRRADQIAAPGYIPRPADTGRPAPDDYEAFHYSEEEQDFLDSLEPQERQAIIKELAPLSREERAWLLAELMTEGQ